MATLVNPPVLNITGSPTPGKSVITVSYDVAFSKFDIAADQPYRETVVLKGDDTGTGDGAGAGACDTLMVLVPSSIVVPSIIQASNRAAGATNLHRPFTFTIPNAVLDEDKPPVPNPDEIRAVVTLSPVAPVGVGPVESNLKTVTLP